MKSTVVPAQVTTVEDKVAGNLGFSQLILLAVPVFGGALLYAALPPSMNIALYKLVVIGIVALFSATLAIRVKGKIVLLWLVVLLRYNLRPKYYLFNKNSLQYREDYPEPKVESTEKAHKQQVKKTIQAPKLNLMELREVYTMLDNPNSKIRFETSKKGGINVHLTEIQEQS
ncbi:MAG: PrgI family protein [Candidatus Microsaccharimonas sp.]